jgi:hypothetical protein
MLYGKAGRTLASLRPFKLLQRSRGAGSAPTKQASSSLATSIGGVELGTGRGTGPPAGAGEEACGEAASAAVRA